MYKKKILYLSLYFSTNNGKAFPFCKEKILGREGENPYCVHESLKKILKKKEIILIKNADNYRNFANIVIKRRRKQHQSDVVFTLIMSNCYTVACPLKISAKLLFCILWVGFTIYLIFLLNKRRYSGNY